MRNMVAVIAGVVILLLVNWSITGKERHLKEGIIVYLELAPVDPRSLMQGDYMALRFKLANEVNSALPKNNNKNWRRNVAAGDGRVVVTLDEKGVGHFKRLDDETPLAADELLMRYRVRDGVLKFATNAFFFQEGHAELYQKAVYGQFRVDDNGELLLTSMYDEDLNKLGVETD